MGMYSLKKGGYVCLVMPVIASRDWYSQIVSVLDMMMNIILIHQGTNVLGIYKLYYLGPKATIYSTSTGVNMQKTP
jgi:hypothetical protein